MGCRGAVWRVGCGEGVWCGWVVGEEGEGIFRERSKWIRIVHFLQGVGG